MKQALTNTSSSNIILARPNKNTQSRTDIVIRNEIKAQLELASLLPIPSGHSLKSNSMASW